MPNKEQLEDVVAEYIHWREVNSHIKGGENYLKRLHDVMTESSTTNLSALDSDEAVEVVTKALSRLQPRVTMTTEFSQLCYLANAETYAKAAIQAVKGILGGGNEW